MIIVDIETSGNLNPEEIGIWQIGAVEFENPNNTFLEEARIDETDKIEEESLKVTGKTEKELRDKTKQSQKQLLKNFFDWAEKVKARMFVAHCPTFDYDFLCLKAKRYNLKFPFKHRTIDLHTIASLRYFQVNNRFMLKEGFSELGLKNILEFCGIEDKRRSIDVENRTLVKSGTPHNGLEDARLEAECLSRLLYGKGLLEEFEKFKVPDCLRR